MTIIVKRAHTKMMNAYETCIDPRNNMGFHNDTLYKRQFQINTIFDLLQNIKKIKKNKN